MLLLSSLFLFFRTEAWGMELPTFRLGLPTLMNPVKITPTGIYTHVHTCIHTHKVSDFHMIISSIAPIGFLVQRGMGRGFVALPLMRENGQALVLYVSGRLLVGSLSGPVNLFRTGNLTVCELKTSGTSRFYLVWSLEGLLLYTYWSSTILFILFIHLRFTL